MKRIGWVTIILYLITQNGFSGDFSTQDTEVRAQLIHEINNFRSLLNSADRYLETYQAHLRNAREILVRGAHGIYTPQDRAGMIKMLNRELVQAGNVIEFARFNDREMFYLPDSGPSHEYRITLFAGREPDVFVLFDPRFDHNLDILLSIYRDIRPYPGHFEMSIGLIDVSLRSAAVLRGRILAYIANMEDTIRLHNSYINNPQGVREEAGNLKSDLEYRIYKLTIRAANSFYSLSDRAILDFDFQRQVWALKRLEEVTGIRSAYSDLKDISIDTQEKAIQEMLRLGDILNKENMN